MHILLFKYYYCIPVEIHGIHYHTREIQFRQKNVSCPHSLGADEFKHTQKRRPYSKGDGQCIMLLQCAPAKSVRRNLSSTHFSHNEI